MKGLIVAGEASGDLYAGRLAALLKTRISSLELAGMGGGQLQKAGARLLYHFEKITVVGVFEIASKLRLLHQALDSIRRWVDEEHPAFAVLIDFPDFNFRLARYLRSRGVKIFYFISPQVWAWRKSRISFLKRHVDLMITVLPFEKELYEKAGVPVVWVGHPLVEIVRAEVASQPEFPRPEAGRLLLGIMPGSREVEVRRHLPILSRTAELLRARLPLLQTTLLIWPPSLDRAGYQVDPALRVIAANRYAAMQACDLLLVASGTSTLECAILGSPLLIVYRVSRISWWIGKMLVRVPYYGLVNWIAGRRAIPEHIQDGMEPRLLAEESERLLRDGNARSAMKADLETIVQSLGPPGAMDRAADEIVKRL